MFCCHCEVLGQFKMGLVNLTGNSKEERASIHLNPSHEITVKDTLPREGTPDSVYAVCPCIRHPTKNMYGEQWTLVLEYNQLFDDQCALKIIYIYIYKTKPFERCHTSVQRKNTLTNYRSWHDHSLTIFTKSGLLLEYCFWIVANVPNFSHIVPCGRQCRTTYELR